MSNPAASPDERDQNRDAERDQKREKAAFWDGVRVSTQTVPGLFAWGAVSGMAMVQSGLSVWQAVVMTLVVYGGSAQLAVLPLIAVGAPIGVMALTALMVNLRFVIFSAVIGPHFIHLKWWQRLWYGYNNVDLVMAFFPQRYPAHTVGKHAGKLGYFRGLFIPNWWAWQLGTMEAQKEVVRANNLESCYLRPLVWIGSEKMGVSARGNTIHVGIAAWPWGAYLGEDGIKRGIRVKTSSFTRHHVNVSMVRAKASGYYINSILANQEVTAEGYDEALLLDTDGYVSEGAGENVFVIKNGKIYTPDLASCLDGITRDAVLTMARDLGIEIVEKRITRDEVYCADEAFFTGTAAEITPIRELDNREIGIGSRGPITEKLQSLFFDVVGGKSDKYRHWLTKV